ncbi:C40 family peptidase [Clostridium guangxiense]|uniref:C40 family peptidase n=1 Tax=Clostridium guangxiense TaxID=1662055 RepID=UPI001E3C8F83|nr:C40 family peptidase [Clostridium guangxiense]MCD2348386.1 NlpC/P60 family protein [Clostridium guangxiense]
MHKKLVSVFVALGVTLSCTSNTLAAPLQQQYSSSLQQYENALKGVQEIEDKISVIDNEIGKINNDISSTNNKISESKAKISDEQQKLNEAQEQIEEEQSIYRQRVKAMYISNTDMQYIEVILNSKTFSDLIDNVENVKNLIQYDTNIIDNINKQKQSIDNQKKTLEADNFKLEKLQSENRSKLNALNSKKAEQNKLMASEKAEENNHKADMEKIQSAMDAEKKKLQALNVSTSSGSSSGSSSVNKITNPTVNPSPSSSASGLAIVKYASQFVGVPYVWGGESPSGFDCSGLVQYVYAQFGISLPRTSEAQVGCGSPVTGDLEPGDLLFFEPASDGPGHVGIYAGDNTFIEAPHTGANVRIMPLRSYCAARRIIK